MRSSLSVRDIFFTILILALTVAAVIEVIQLSDGFRKGIMPLRVGNVSRLARPRLFWFAIVVQILSVLMLLIIGGCLFALIFG
jgi:hypothetical protein